MFSPNLTRFIIDPDNVTDNGEENRKVSVEKQIFRYSILDHEKVLNDYNFFTGVLQKLVKVYSFFTSYKDLFKKTHS